MTSDIVREAMLRVLTWRLRELTHRPDPDVVPVSSHMGRRDVAV